MRYGAAILLVAACVSSPKGHDITAFAGVWESPGGFEYHRLTIAPDGAVAWLSTGSLDTFKADRTGRWRSGVLTLNEPVPVYGPDDEQEFHLFKSRGRAYLVPHGSLELVENDDDPFGDSWFGLRRRLSKGELRRRFDASADPEKRTRLLEEWSRWPRHVEDRGFLLGLMQSDASAEVRRKAEHALDPCEEEEE